MCLHMQTIQKTLLCIVIVLTVLSTAPCTVTGGVLVILSVHLYLPVSDVVRVEKVRVSPSAEILSGAVSITEPFTTQPTVESTAESTAGLKM